MTLATSVMTLLWAFPFSLATVIAVGIIVFSVVLIGGFLYWRSRRAEVVEVISRQS